jgi:hypothetical protein
MKRLIQFWIIIEASSRPLQACSKPEADCKQLGPGTAFSGAALLVSLVRVKISSPVAMASKELAFRKRA